MAMRRDVVFLRRHNLMDYSLLLGIETEDRSDGSMGRRETIRLQKMLKNQDGSKKDFSNIDIGEVFAENHRFKHENKLFHVSIIDYLQEWNLGKKSERFVKTTLLNKKGKQLSAMEPIGYAKRFQHFMDANVFI
jgi:hypothetical protein